MKKNKFHRFFKSLLSIVLFPIWIIAHPLMMVVASLSKKFANSKLMRSSTNYGNQVQKRFLVSERSSRASFTFAHGLLHILILIFSLAFAIWFYKVYINQSTSIKNKHLNIEAKKDQGPSGHAAADTTIKDQLQYFSMAWSKNKTAISPSTEASEYMSLYFYPERNEVDTTYFEIIVHADFDLKIDTTRITDGFVGDKIKDHYYNYKVERFGEIDGKYFIVIKLMCLPIRDYSGKDTLWADASWPFIISAHPKMYDDNDPPYLNYFIDFHLDLRPRPEEDYHPGMSNNEMNFFFWDSYSFIIDTDSVYISDYPYLHFPFELIDVKPSPISNRLYDVRYSGKSFDEAIDRGIYFRFLNHDLLQENDRNAFFKTVLVGALISFLLTILIELFTKWRNLNIRSGNKDPYGDKE